MLRQTKKIDEIVICDDGSTDDTIQIIKAYQAQYPGIIHLYQNEKQLGSTKNMEQCLGLTSGDLVFLADQDDIWLPNKVARLYTFFEAHPNAEAVFSNAELINEADILIPNLHLWDIIGFPQKNLPNNLDFFDFLSRVDNIVTGAGLAIKNVKQLLTTPFPNVQGLLHDGWIALYYSSKGRLSYCDEILFQYRIHPAQQMGGNIADPNGLLKMNLDLFESRMDTSSFVKTKAYWNRMEQNLRVQNALKSNYQTLDIDHIALINKMDLQINKFYKVGASVYPLRAKLRNIKKAMGF